MINLRKYGDSPYNTAVIHGGPGAPGEMAPVARKLSQSKGILEPLQTKATINGQLEELKNILIDNSSLQVTLIGYSWGAMLSYIFTAQNPSMVNKLIMVSSGVFEEKYAAKTMKLRLSRLPERERLKAETLQQNLNNPLNKNKNILLAQLGALMFIADSYNPLPYKNEIIECQYDIYKNVWKEAQNLRSSGTLLNYGHQIRCPVIAIHGDYDPHPYEGIKTPLQKIINDFRSILLKNCGHHPWYEKAARQDFFDILFKEIS